MTPTPESEAAAQLVEHERWTNPMPPTPAPGQPDWLTLHLDAVEAQLGRVTRRAHKRRMAWLAARYRLSPAALVVKLVESECAGEGKV